MYNLCQNSLRHSQPTDTIGIFIRTRGEQCDIAVVDTGCGITSTHLPHVMERHYGSQGHGSGNGRRNGQSIGRSNAKGNTEHAGLGLAIVKRIAKLHGSDLKICSIESIGTAVAFTLPARSSYSINSPEVKVPLPSS